MTANNNKDEHLTCQWQGCSEKFDTAEDLYNHLCDIHVGRKSTNNLCLTCAWGTCRTTTVKRDHITSHIRVHVPLKPHKCDFCGKAFKRPQDLKKHVKTHADDSVLLRSPEPDGTGRRQAGGHGMQYTSGVNMQPLATTAAQAYYGIMHSAGLTGMQPHGVPGLGQHYPNSAAYGPGAAAQQQQQQAQQQHNEKKRSFDGVDQFFDDAKRHKIQPVYDGAMAQRLSALQFIPSTSAEGVDFGHAATVTAPPTNGNTPSFTLPSLRTKQDLIDADNFLTQLSTNIYDSTNPNNFSPYRQQHNGSPHTPQAQTQQPSPQQNQGHEAPPAPMASSAPPSVSGTAALTPPHSNYTTSHSPHHSPTNVSPQSSSNMYPTLPGVSSADISSGYPAPVSSAPASSLGSAFDSTDRRRYPVGVLQRAQPENKEQDDVTMEEGTATLDPMIDPSLGAIEAAPQVDKAAAASAAREAEVIITNLKNYIKQRLAEEEEREKNGEAAPVQGEQQQEDTQMTDAEVKNEQNQEDAQALYPILQAVAAC
ncbi:hypothetical protein FPQ18DRAFT_258511 [Pyronema domesticum]|nr:hypothetical protein FPQ18DRAFT_258511 [Pyronema domesticum]